MGRVTVEMTGDEARLVRALDKVIAKERELARKAAEAGSQSAAAADKASGAYGKLADRIKGTGKGFEKARERRKAAFGSEAAAELASYAGRMVSLTAVIGGVVSALRDARDLSRELASSQRASEGGLSQLAQLAGGSPDKMRALGLQSRLLYAQGVGANLSEAAQVVFQLESAGINTKDVRGTFASLGQSISDPVGFARSAKTLQAALGEDRAGSIRDILSRAFQASAASPAQTPELLEAAAGSAAFAGQAGVGIDELLAGTAILATKTGSASVGGTQMRAFVKAMGQREETRRAMQSGGLRGALDYLQSEGLTSQAAFTAEPSEGGFGMRAEAFQGMRGLLESQDIMGDEARKIGAAPARDLVGQVGASLKGDPGVRAARLARIAEIEKELAGAERGARENVFQGAMDTQEARYRREAEQGGLSGVVGEAKLIGFRNIARPLAEMASESERESIIRSNVAQGDADPESVEILSDIREMMSQFRAARPHTSDPGD